MNVLVWAFGGIATFGAGVYLAAIAIESDDRGPLWYWPYPELWLPVGAAVVFGSATLVLKVHEGRRSKPDPVAAPVAAGRGIVSSGVPGVYRQGAVAAHLNIRDRSYRVVWQSNGVQIGSLIPEKSGFNILDENGKLRGWAPSREEGMTRLELDASR